MQQNLAPKAPHRGAARLYGIFFLLAFLSYGSGSALVAAYADGPTGMLLDKAAFVTGFVLMAVVHGFVNIGMAVVMLPILKTFNQTVAYGYVSAAITATVIAMIGAMFLLLLLPLADVASATGMDAAYVEMLAELLKKGGFYGYQLGMTIWGLGGLMMCYLLFISKLVPRVFPIWGGVGYLVFMTGTLAELYGYGIGLMLSAPGGLFEIGLSLWLIFKGFSHPKPSAA